MGFYHFMRLNPNRDLYDLSNKSPSNKVKSFLVVVVLSKLSKTL